MAKSALATPSAMCIAPPPRPYGAAAPFIALKSVLVSRRQRTRSWVECAALRGRVTGDITSRLQPWPRCLPPPASGQCDRHFRLRRHRSYDSDPAAGKLSCPRHDAVIHVESIAKVLAATDDLALFVRAQRSEERRVGKE